jgi:hypothetical protein
MSPLKQPHGRPPHRRLQFANAAGRVHARAFQQVENDEGSLAPDHRRLGGATRADSMQKSETAMLLMQWYMC